MADALLHHGALVWGVSVLAWALRPQFSPIRWGDSNLLVTPLLRVIPRREKLRKGQPPRHLPLPSMPPRSGGNADRADGDLTPRRSVEPPGAPGPDRHRWVGYSGAAANPGPQKKSDRPAQAAGSGGDDGVRPRLAPHSPRSAPLCANASRKLRAKPSAVQGSMVRNRTGRAGSQLAASSLARSWAATRASALAGPGPRPLEAPPVEAPPRCAHSAAYRDANSGEARARRAPASSNTQYSPRCDRRTHSWARRHTGAASPFPTVRPWGAPCPLPAAKRRPGATKLRHPQAHSPCLRSAGNP